MWLNWTYETYVCSETLTNITKNPDTSHSIMRSWRIFQSKYSVNIRKAFVKIYNYFLLVLNFFQLDSLRESGVRFWRVRLNFFLSLRAINIWSKCLISRPQLQFWLFWVSHLHLSGSVCKFSIETFNTVTVWNLGFSRSRLSQLAIATLSGHVKNWEAEGSHRFHMLPRERND